MQKVVIIRALPIVKGPSYEREAVSLSKKGYKVFYLGFDRKDKYPRVSNNKYYKIIRFKYKASGRLDKIIGFIIFYFWILRILKKYKFDIVHVIDFIVFLPAILYKMIYKKKMVYEIRDFFSEEALENYEIVKKFNIIKKLLEKCENKVIISSDAVIFPSYSRALFKKKLLSKINFTIVNNSPKDVYDEISNKVNYIKDKKRKFTLYYAGRIRKNRGLEFICDAIKIINEINLIISGDDPFLEILENKYSGFDNIFFTGSIAHTQVIENEIKSDLLFAFYDPNSSNFNFINPCPNKLYESMMLGKPILINSGISIADEVRRNNIGYIVEYGDKRKLSDLLKCIVLDDNKEALNKKGYNARQLYKQKYDYSYSEIKLINLYNNLTCNLQVERNK